MSHVLNHDGQYFRIEIAEVSGPDQADKPVYVCWSSDAFRELRDAPGQACSRFVAGSPFSSWADALRHAQEWIKIDWDAQQARRARRPSEQGSMMYSVWLLKGDTTTEHRFGEFADARQFAKAAEKTEGVTKVGITNNESPEYLTIWEKGK
jgi:hypothetical protein